MPPFLRLVIALVLIAAALTVFVRWFEPRFAFFPAPGETTTPADFGVAFTPITITTGDGERLHAWWLRASAPRALVVYFHGNGGNLSVWAPIVSEMARRGFDVLAFDYRGYGLSTGRPTEQGLYRDADAILDHAWNMPPRARTPVVVYWGRSLGTAVAAYASSTRPPNGVVLESGFPDARSLVRSNALLAFLALFSSYRFPTAAFLETVQRPVLVMHGDADGVIPFVRGRALFDRLREPKTFVPVPGGDHNDARPADERIYWSAVDTFIQGLRR